MSGLFQEHTFFPYASFARARGRGGGGGTLALGIGATTAISAWWTAFFFGACPIRPVIKLVSAEVIAPILMESLFARST